MTALREFQRLEATGLWRPAPDEQRREVLVSLGDATLVISDFNGRALTHWSIAAIDRQANGADSNAARFFPDGDPGETLDIGADETVMLDAIDKLRSAVERARPHPGRLRMMGLTAAGAACLALAVFWIPGALERQALRVVPDVTRQSIGEKLLERVERLTGPSCHTPESQPALSRLARRLGLARIVVLPTGLDGARLLPGGTALVSRHLVETEQDPNVAAGYLLAEKTRNAGQRALAGLLDTGGIIANVQLLATGDFPDEVLDRHAEAILTMQPAPLPWATLAPAFARAHLIATPYLHDRGLSAGGASGSAAETEPVLADRDWILLQGICADRS